MRSTVMFFILIFALQSQASFLSSMLYKSGIYQSFFWPMSNIHLSIYHDTVETVNNAPLPSVSSTNIDEQDHRQIKSGSSQKRLIRKKVKKQKPKKDASILRDLTNNVGVVQPRNTIIQSSEISQGQLVPSVDVRFKASLDQKKYNEVIELREKMKPDDFLKQRFQAIKTLDQYNRIVGSLKSLNLVTSFYVYGDIGVVKGAIIESKVYINNDYVWNGDLEDALPLALGEDRHVRVMELLDVRKGITAGKGGQLKLKGNETSFETFVDHFLFRLAPWNGGMALRRFLTLRGDEVRKKYPDIFDPLCRYLVHSLRNNLHLPKAERLLVDLIGQPLLLTSVAFARGFLDHGDDWYHSAFIKYGWRDAIQEGLKSEYRNGGKILWRVMQEEKPGQFHGKFPATEETRIAVCKRLPTKQQKEEEWYKKCFMIFLNKLNSESISHIFPNVLWSIIFGYAVSLTFTEDSNVSTK